jgi:putative transposase
MLITRAYTTKLSPTEHQAWQLRNIVGGVRFLKNAALEQRDLSWKIGKRHVSWQDQADELPALKKEPEYSFLKYCPAQSLQQALIDVDDGFQRFFKGLGGYPTPRKKGKSQDSFRLPQPEQILFEPAKQGYVYFPKLGWMRHACTRSTPIWRNGKSHRQTELPYDGELLHVTIKREGKHWYAVFTCEVEIDDPVRPLWDAIGIDMGITNTAVLSNGEYFQLPKITDQEAHHLVRLEQRIKQKQSGSINHWMARLAYQQYLLKLRRRKLDALHKLTHDLCKSHTLIIIEDLDIQGMTQSNKGTIEAPGTDVKKKSRLNRGILDSLWGEFKRQLQYKSKWYGSRVILVPPEYSSQECCKCGHTEEGNRPSRDLFRCLNSRCQHRSCADLNAALVIRERGIRLARGQSLRYLSKVNQASETLDVHKSEGIPVLAGSSEMPCSLGK